MMVWETDLDGATTGVVEEMRGTQRKIDRWIELWQVLHSQIQEKEMLRKKLEQAERELLMTQAECRSIENKSLKLRDEIDNQRQTLSAMENSGQLQRKENEVLNHQLASKTLAVAELQRTAEKAQRHNRMMERVKNGLLRLLAKEPKSPEVLQTEALKIALKHFGTYADLLTCRHVSKTWNTVLTPLVRFHTAQISFDDNATMDAFIKTMYFTRGDNIPTASYKLDEGCLYVGNENRINGFLSLCSPTIQSLSLTCNEDFFNHFKIPTIPSLPSLTTLFVQIISGDQKHFFRAPSSPFLSSRLPTATFLPALVEAASNLTKFSLIISPATKLSHPPTLTVSTILEETFKSLSSTCQELEVDAQITDANLRTLKLANITLRKLTLIIKESSMSSEGFYRFLQTHDETLEELKIVYDEPHGKMRFEFPPLQKLAILNLKGFYDKNAVEPIDYGRNFPRLEKFILHCSNNDKGNEWNRFFPPTSSQAFSVIELMLTLARYDSISYHRIGKLFPNIQKLRLVVATTSPEVQESLWCSMPNLEDLELHMPMGGEGECMDELFTGIPVDLCRQILHQRAFFDPAVDSIHRRSSIRNLKYLKRLKLFMRDHYFTDVTGYNALVHLSNLKHMEVYWDTHFELTQECLRVLRQRFAFVSRKR